MRHPSSLPHPLLQLLMALDHPNIVRCSACFVNPTKVCIVLDYCSEGEATPAPHNSYLRSAPCNHAAEHSKQT
jgi:serine/threonine protein kinase